MGCRSTARTAPLDVASLTFTLYRKGEAIFSKQLIADDSAFRLPAGYMSDYMSVGLTGTVRVRSVKIGDTMQSLRTV